MSDCSTCPSKGSCGKDEATCGIVSNPHSHIQHVIGIMSGKGGVGKSSMTVLLAKQLCKAGYRVGIMDADMTGPSIPRLMGLAHEHAYGSNDAIEPVVDKDGIKVMSLNFLLEDENQPVVWRGPIIANAVKQFWSDVVWGDLDFLLIDMPPGTGDVALTLMQSLPISGMVMVSTPQPMVSMIVSKAINMCKEMKIRVLGVIENMSYIICPDCQKRIDLYQSNDMEAFLKRNDLPLFAELPMMDLIANIHKDDDYTSDAIALLDEAMKPAVDGLLKAL
ncbi:Mrp/NBP35 family ATP-binding protein [Massilicoli timonensis]|uniref:Iron-sulfur cluster carrier protein n=1 Tax=Massilicoli timonensis TaxID=2015901 RepID=A0ABT1SMP4_9FIRM|nr:Mrp/NBP35 family ATP-binding protein [Massilicoli timonensis]MCQ5122487.1 Mrp/NBP35 family ATP-binding protein [Massilicoli timonensis]